MQQASIKPSEAAEAILRLVHPEPGQVDIPAGQALAEVEAVLRLEKALRESSAELKLEAGQDWRSIAAVAVRKLKEAP